MTRWIELVTLMRYAVSFLKVWYETPLCHIAMVVRFVRSEAIWQVFGRKQVLERDCCSPHPQVCGNVVRRGRMIPQRTPPPRPIETDLWLCFRGITGILLSFVTVSWCSMSASKLFVCGFAMDSQQPLIAYPCALLYAVFALLTVFWIIFFFFRRPFFEPFPG